MFMMHSLCNLCMNYIPVWNYLKCTDCDALGGQEKLYPFGGLSEHTNPTKEAVSGYDT